MDLKDKTVLVTGSTHGIGRACGLAFLQKGSRVVFNGRKEMPEDLQAELAAYPGQWEYLPADVSQEADVKGLIKQVVAEFGSLDVLVHSAGITKDQIMIGLKTSDFDEVINVNLRGSFLINKYAMKKMLKQRRGAIINLSSVVGMHGNQGQANYAAAKAGVIGLTKTAAKEGAARGVRVNAIAPGMIETRMTEAVSDEAAEAALAAIPLGRYGQASEIAHAAIFLAENDYITGQALVVDGGMTI